VWRAQSTEDTEIMKDYSHIFAPFCSLVFHTSSDLYCFSESWALNKWNHITSSFFALNFMSQIHLCYHTALYGTSFSLLQGQASTILPIFLLRAIGWLPDWAATCILVKSVCLMSLWGAALLLLPLLSHKIPLRLSEAISSWNHTWLPC
jgi:hypothetical protein